MRNLLKYSAVVLLSSISLMHSFYADAQIVKRDILQRSMQQVLPGALIPQGQFRPFPQSAGEWKQVLPDSVISAIIRVGE
ncbi:MAG: hypothetical protein ACTHLD_15865, partial [Chitinophaga sp.]